jgi:hypothetical protein
LPQAGPFRFISLQVATRNPPLVTSLPTVHDHSNDPFKSAGVDPGELSTLPDLPPVEPPSAGFVVQLFVIPAAVVLVVVVVWLLFGKLAGGERDAIEYVHKLRSPTANWRLAFELASLIQHDPKTGSDPVLLGELTELLSQYLNESDADPELTQYLALTLGAFQTLEARTESGQAVDPLVPLARALAPKYKPRIRLAAAASLAKQAARMNGELDDPAAIRALGEAASSGEPEVRQMAVYALGFFGGSATTEILRDRVKTDEDRFVRYNAAVALGRRGDIVAEGTLAEMLSTTDLGKVLDLASVTEKQNKIESIELEALEALRTSISAGSPALARSLSSSLTGLTKSGLVSVRSQALEVLQSLQAQP